MRLIFLIVLVWFVLGSFLNLNKVFLPDALDLLQAFYEEAKSGQLYNNIVATSIRVFSGLSVGAIVGVFFGVLMGLSRVIRKEVMPLVEFLRGIPTSMLFPVFIVMFGVGELSKTVIVATTTFPIILVNTVVGFMPRPETQDRRDYMKVHAKKIPHYIKIVALIWDALPPIIGGLKVAISISLVLTIVTEMFFVASSGVGWAAHEAYLAFDLGLMYSYVIVVGLAGLGLNYAFDKIYSRLVKNMG